MLHWLYWLYWLFLLAEAIRVGSKTHGRSGSSGDVVSRIKPMFAVHVNQPILGPEQLLERDLDLAVGQQYQAGPGSGEFRRFGGRDGGE